MRKIKNKLNFKRKVQKQKLDPIIKVAIINGIFAVIVALITKLF